MGEAVTIRDGRSVLVDVATLETDQRATMSVQSLAGDLVLGADALSYYLLDPGASDRNVTIPAASTVPFKRIRFLNSGTSKSLFVNDGGAVTVKIKKGEQYVFNSDGVNWYTREDK